MFAINHAATALALRRAFPKTSLLLLLVSVQIMEIAWVAFNILGIERVATEESVRSVSDIHLAHMPWSHSVLTMLLASMVLGGLTAWATRRPRAGLAVGIGVASHLVLDLVTHAPDIALAPFLAATSDTKYGMGLYEIMPMLAFGVELAWGLLCVAIFRGGKGLYAAVVVFNLANLTMFTPELVGLEGALAGHPMAIVALVAVQIAVTLGLVGYLANQGRGSSSSEDAALELSPRVTPAG